MIEDISLEIAAYIKDIVTVYGQTVTIFKFTPTAPNSIYRQNARTFDATTVSLTAHVSFEDSVDTITPTGNDNSITGYVTFSRILLEQAFPTVTSYKEMINLADELGIGDNRYRIIDIQYTSQLKDIPETVYLKFAAKPGKKFEGV